MTTRKKKKEQQQTKTTTTTTSSKRTKAERKEEHLKLLEKLEQLELADSCCDICHCDCYSTHGSSIAGDADGGDCGEAEAEADDSGICTLRELDEELALFEELARLEREEQLESEANRQRLRKSKRQKVDTSGADLNVSASDKPNKKAKSKTRQRSASTHRELPIEGTNASASASRAQTPTVVRRSSQPNTEDSTLKTRVESRQRAKSACNQRSHSASALDDNRKQLARQINRKRVQKRDCHILQDLLSTLDDDTITTALPNKLSQGVPKINWKSQQMLPTTSTTSVRELTLAPLIVPLPAPQPLQLCATMANLCLAPTVREAYQRVPTHDKKILNRMAIKRTQQAVAKEHAWLARKYWENERLERELLKVEQVEEYKRAVHDKQFQDYLETKARLNALAQRDLNELQRLRANLHDKDERTKQRLEALRMERDIQLCQRRCDELRRNEAVNVQQEEQQLDNTVRKRDICMRLTQRLRRADEIRNRMLDGYLKRLQHDNYMEQLQHEEHWRERQQLEQMKREQLKAHIQHKRRQCQRFIEHKQRRNEVITRTAKISASLRELVRQSVTPDGDGGGGIATNGASAASAFYIQNHATLSRLLLDRPPSRVPGPTSLQSVERFCK